VNHYHDRARGPIAYYWLLITPCSQSINRVAFTSSGAAIMREQGTPIVLTKEDWSVLMLKELRGNALASVK